MHICYGVLDEPINLETLSRASRRLHSIANGLLYERIILQWRTESWLIAALTRPKDLRRLKLLLRTFRERPSLLSHVEYLKVDCGFDLSKLAEEVPTHKHLQVWRELRRMLSEGCPSEQDAETSEQRGGTFSRLTVLHLVWPQTTMEHLHGILGLPKLQQLTLDCNPWLEAPSSTAKTFLPYASPLSRLRIGPRGGIDSRLLRETIRLRPNIARLQLAAIDSSYLNPSTRIRPQLLTSWNIQPVLQLAQNHLRHLEVNVGLSEEVYSADPSLPCLDLSALPKLLTADLPSIWFLTRTRFPRRIRSVHERCPAYLEELTIRFRVRYYWIHDDDAWDISPGEEDSWVALYQWLLNLLERKQSSFSKLTRIYVEDEWDPDCNNYIWVKKRWPLPKSLSIASQAAGVELDIQLHRAKTVPEMSWFS